MHTEPEHAQLSSDDASNSRATEAPQLRVLLVEDDDNDSELIGRMLHRGHGRSRVRCTQSSSVAQAVARLRSADFDAVLLDLGLPDALGFSALTEVLASRPTVPVVVITGSEESQLGLHSVRMGAQDYLTKGELTPALLSKSLQYAVERARSINKEKQLLEETLHGTIRALTTVLSLVNPTAFGRAERLKECVALPAKSLGMHHPWIVEVAAMVSQLGWVQRSAEECAAFYSQRSPDGDRRRSAQDMPAIAAELLAGIPHLESVREILALQANRASARNDTSPRSSDVQIGAELLFIANEFDMLETQLGSKEQALQKLYDSASGCDPIVLRAFVESQRQILASSIEATLRIAELVAGMVLVDDVITPDGRLVMARGHQVTVSMLERLRYFCERKQVAEPIRVSYARGLDAAATA